MLEHYFIRPDTVDRIRSSWLGEPIEKYVIWLRENKYANRNVYRRVPILVQFAITPGRKDAGNGLTCQRLSISSLRSGRGNTNETAKPGVRGTTPPQALSGKCLRSCCRGIKPAAG